MGRQEEGSYVCNTTLQSGKRLIAKVIALEDTSGNKTRGRLDGVSSNEFLWEGNDPGVIAKDPY